MPNITNFDLYRLLWLIFLMEIVLTKSLFILEFNVCMEGIFNCFKNKIMSNVLIFLSVDIV